MVWRIFKWACIKHRKIEEKAKPEPSVSSPDQYVAQGPSLLEDRATPSRNTLPMARSAGPLSRIYLPFRSSQEDEYNALCQEEHQPNPIMMCSN